MKISKRVKLWAISGACVCLLGVCPNFGYAQEGEAVEVDSLLMNKTTDKAPTHVPKIERATTAAPEVSSEGQEIVNEGQKALEESLAAAKVENEDEALLAKKIKLAKEMHNIRPTREQVDSAILKAASKLSEYERANFISAMKSMLNYNAIERISVDAMVETYSYNELESMVGYFSKPEAKSASKKIGPWAQKVQPEIVRMIDRAMMRIRTGQ
jgi:uncharacterized membrane protein